MLKKQLIETILTVNEYPKWVNGMSYYISWNKNGKYVTYIPLFPNLILMADITN